ncbi:hypothetical protein CYMTET_4630 [Cymbomonas tetramitiformis]|uniref:Uncharacterized protein n=1 Tax=Cymbomonas tetramitiformis TaxID=36881 RepID=A0AAE0H112_9CHLO|nr:hypothetical protein CYMTET_4630 [Cymbomonas tetramitiformis]
MPTLMPYRACGFTALPLKKCDDKGAVWGRGGRRDNQKSALTRGSLSLAKDPKDAPTKQASRIRPLCSWLRAACIFLRENSFQDGGGSNNGSSLLRISGHKCAVVALAMSNNHVIFSACEASIRACKVNCKEGTYGAELLWENIDVPNVSKLAVTADGATLCAGSETGEVALLFPYDGALLGRFSAHTGPRACILAMTTPPAQPPPPNGRSSMLVTAAATSYIGVWVVKNQNLGSDEPAAQTQMLSGHEGPVTCVLLGNNGLRLYSACAARSIRVWVDRAHDVDLGGGSCSQFECVVVVEKAHAGPITALCIGHREKVFYTGSQEATIKAWKAKVNESGQTDTIGRIMARGAVCDLVYCKPEDTLYSTVFTPVFTVHSHSCKGGDTPATRMGHRYRGEESEGEESINGSDAEYDEDEEEDPDLPRRPHPLSSKWGDDDEQMTREAAHQREQEVTERLLKESQHQAVQFVNAIKEKERRLQDCSLQASHLMQPGAEFETPKTVKAACSVLGLPAAVESSAEGDDMPARKVILKAYGAQRLVADASQQEVEGRLGFIFPTEAEEAEAIAAAARVRALQLQLTDAFKLLTSTQTVHPVVTNKPRPNSRAHNGAEGSRRGSKTNSPAGASNGDNTSAFDDPE